MSRVYVAVDLETTGFNADRDSIIEVGGVRFRDGAVLETFSEVVNPGRPLPRAIQQLTGITQADVDKAPTLANVANAFRRFIGDAPLIGHNIAFDAGFLKANNLFAFNPLIDTWELAVILVPGLASYKLGRVAEALGFTLENAHRAFEDAEASMLVFEALRQRLMGLPAPVLKQINRLAQNTDWSLKEVFAEGEREAAFRKPAGQPAGWRTDAGPLFEDLQPLEPVSQPQPLAIDALAANLEPGGEFGRFFANYEHRPQQVDMLRTVADAFNRSQHLLIEAGTGTGKSVAYLIPALAWSVQTGQRVVVSSNTINLQEQLFHKDLPDLRAILPYDFKVTVMKGRGNYLCTRRLNNLLQRGDLTATDVSVLARILVWLPTTTTGDVSELTLVNNRERAVWQRVCSESGSCSPARCNTGKASEDYFYRARRQAEAAHVVIVNHALLLADIATENKVLPAYQYLVVDEAHHLEEATTNALALVVDHASFVGHLRDLAPTSSENKGVGLLADVATAVRNACPPDKAERIVTLTAGLADAVPTLDYRMFEVMDAVERFVKNQSGDRRGESNSYDLRQRLTNTERVQPAWVNVEITWDNLSLLFKRFNDELERLINGLSDLSNYPIANLEDLVSDLQAILRALEETYLVLDAAVFKPDANTIYWIRYSQQYSSVAVHSAPLHVGNLIQRHLFLPKDTVILTTATLRTSNSFDCLRGRLSMDDAGEKALDSPFDYKTSALLYLPTDIPEPNEPAFQTQVEQAILQLAVATKGRLMALFTSYAQLQRTTEALRDSLEEAGLTLYVQGEGGSRQQILEAFRQSERAVIMGTRSFWEGVDVQGEALSALVIVKLPFAVPTDPVVAARSETFDSPFYNYTVPEAILALRQGFGRLIRSASDRGVCAILDRRLVSKSYGRLFIESLPACTVQRGPLANAPLAAKKWLDGEMPSGEALPGNPSPGKVRPGSSPPPASTDFVPQPPPPEWWE